MAHPTGDDNDGSPAGTGDGPHPSLLYAVKQVELAARAHIDELVKPAGITALQYTALTVLRRRDGLSSAQLARNSFVTAQSMADMVTAVERRGLISRRRDPDNRRVLLISLTDTGRELLAAFDEAVDALEERMVSALTAAQRRNLEDYLNRCRAALSDQEPH
ncbi:MarR family transcriptional regulator [Streptomyces sp. 549]|uniref:MarR family winged helix-turn-helix transcriptional regulator n=1 Tax=Streptomyces sp. 549 TaxID=3049076 RepID=UPI0024C32562|nr:MarR family transcriptional regulator [Streptomyces sp. 549]MDK1471881.1 MarR family transcriptional regulator [Streptomyces sp. 549]